MMPQFSSKKSPWDLIQFSQSPSAALSYFPESHRWSEVFPFKGDFSFGKSQKPQGTKSRLYGAELPGWFDVLQRNSAQDMMHEQAHCCDEAANHQLPMAATSWIIQIVSMEECLCLKENLMQIFCSTHSVILNVMATQYTCFAQWHLPPLLTSTVKSSLFIHVHSSPLSLASRFHWCHANLLIILTMAGHFPDRPHII